MDERICDGLYFARSFKLLEKYIANPHLLEAKAPGLVSSNDPDSALAPQRMSFQGLGIVILAFSPILTQSPR